MCQPGDYFPLKEKLEEQNSLLDFVETDYGHLSLYNPNLDYKFEVKT